MRSLLVKSIIYVFLVNFVGFVGATEKEHGISMGASTRVIFHSDEKRISFPISNRNANKLIFHGLVLEKDKSKYSHDFIVSPEVSQLDSYSDKMIQVVRIAGNYPDDRESLLYLQGHFLPASRNEKDQSSELTLSYVMLMKMFFRPKKLRASFDAIDDVADQLDFKVFGNELRVFNRSPYYMTLNFIRSDKEIIQIPDSNSMIAPYDSIILNIKHQNVNSISWSLINDGGYATKLLTRKL